MMPLLQSEIHECFEHYEALYSNITVNTQGVYQPCGVSPCYLGERYCMTFTQQGATAAAACAGCSQSNAGERPDQVSKNSD